MIFIATKEIRKCSISINANEMIVGLILLSVLYHPENVVFPSSILGERTDDNYF